jgi:ketosteroid isomerase-like protein
MSQENVEIVRRLFDARERDDLPAALACLDPDVEFIPLRAGTEGAYRGREGFEKFLADTSENFEIFVPRYTFQEVADRVLAWGTIHLRARGSGVEMEVPTGGIFDFRGGRIVRWHDFGSKNKALKACERTE